LPSKQIEALTGAAEDLDRDPGIRMSKRRAIVAVFVFADPGSVEVGHMLWCHVDLASGRLQDAPDPQCPGPAAAEDPAERSEPRSLTI
jgi:hypothetical protein